LTGGARNARMRGRSADLAAWLVIWGGCWPLSAALPGCLSGGWRRAPARGWSS